jgi:hypothetical protein
MPFLNINELNMQNTIEQPVGVKKSEISRVAYQMWEKAGYPTDRDLQFWLDAETQLRAAAKVASAPSVASSSPVASDNMAVHRAASVQPGPSPPNSAKAQRESRKL